MGHRAEKIFLKPISVPWSCKLPSGQRSLQNNWEESGRREAAFFFPPISTNAIPLFKAFSSGTNLYVKINN
jgi:hypothetical protein